MKLGCYKVYHDSVLPKNSTTHAACFDIYAYLPLNESIKSYTSQNTELQISCCSQISDSPLYIEILPLSRILIPTGIIFDIPEGYSVRLHARSGMALKEGLVLANSEGIVDSDYTDQTYIILTNISMNRVKIYHAQRIAQGELVKSLDYSIEQCYHKPSVAESNRTGGFGSTGTI